MFAPPSVRVDDWGQGDGEPRQAFYGKGRGSDWVPGSLCATGHKAILIARFKRWQMQSSQYENESEPDALRLYVSCLGEQPQPCKHVLRKRHEMMLLCRRTEPQGCIQAAKILLKACRLRLKRFWCPVRRGRGRSLAQNGAAEPLQIISSRRNEGPQDCQSDTSPGRRAGCEGYRGLEQAVAPASSMRQQQHMHLRLLLARAAICTQAANGRKPCGRLSVRVKGAARKMRTCSQKVRNDIRSILRRRLGFSTLTLARQRAPHYTHPAALACAGGKKAHHPGVGNPRPCRRPSQRVARSVILPCVLGHPAGRGLCALLKKVLCLAHLAPKELNIGVDAAHPQMSLERLRIRFLRSFEQKSPVLVTQVLRGLGDSEVALGPLASSLYRTPAPLVRLP
eukprot:scaffold169875_cov26-Tisochrysis_lutea.AAC.1